METEQIEVVINKLLDDAKKDGFKIMKGLAKSVFRPMQPTDFKDAYLSISKVQGEDLVELIKQNNLKNIVEFGTSFGISTLYMAQGILETKGKIVTSELIASKAEIAKENFRVAGVDSLIEVKIGDAMETLKDHQEPIDLLFLDGWKDLYLPLFLMLEPNFHAGTLIYVDNADMSESKEFLKTISNSKKYKFESKFGGKAVLVALNSN